MQEENVPAETLRSLAKHLENPSLSSSEKKKYYKQMISQTVTEDNAGKYLECLVDNISFNLELLPEVFESIFRLLEHDILSVNFYNYKKIKPRILFLNFLKNKR